MGYYKWSSAIVYSGELILLDDSQTCACVRAPRILLNNDSGDIGELANSNAEILNLAILEKYGKRSADSDGQRVVEPSDRLIYIPVFGYFLVNINETSIETKDGGSAEVLVATRVKSTKGKQTNFYLFKNADGSSYSGKIGNYSIHLWDAPEGKEKYMFHFEMICHGKRF